MEGKNLQNAVRQIEMSEEMKDRVINNVLEKGERRPARVARPLRAALIAACVCLLLAGTAAAAVSGMFGQRQTFVDKEDGAQDWYVEQTLKLFPLEAFSYDVQSVLRADGSVHSLEDRYNIFTWHRDPENPLTPEVYWVFPFDTWEEMEAFLGISLPNSVLLEQPFCDGGNSYPFSVTFDSDGSLKVRADWENEGFYVAVTMRIYSERFADSEQGDGEIIVEGDSFTWNATYTLHEGQRQDHTTYQIPNGPVAYLSRFIDDDSGTYTADLIVDGISIYINVLDAAATAARYDENGLLIGDYYVAEDGVTTGIGTVPYDPDMSLDYDGMLYSVLDGFAAKE